MKNIFFVLCCLFVRPVFAADWTTVVACGGPEGRIVKLRLAPHNYDSTLTVVFADSLGVYKDQVKRPEDFFMTSLMNLKFDNADQLNSFVENASKSVTPVEQVRYLSPGSSSHLKLALQSRQLSMTEVKNYMDHVGFFQLEIIESRGYLWSRGTNGVEDLSINLIGCRWEEAEI